MLLIDGNIMNEELLKILVNEKAVVKLVRKIGDGRYYTRKLLGIMKGWGYGHKLMLKAHRMGLIEREKVKPEGKGNWRIYNRVTPLGKKVIKLAEEIGV